MWWWIIHCLIVFIMRSFRPYDRTKQSSQEGKKKLYRERQSTEWDVRIDCDPEDANIIVEHIKASQSLLTYALVSGVEMPDVASAGKHHAKERHVHIALITEYPMRRDQILVLCRGFFKRGDEYAMPRNRKFTYAGWYLHHTKMDYKLVQQPAQLFECGHLPEDDLDEQSAAKVLRMFKKFGTGEPRQEAVNYERFSRWIDFKKNVDA
jgi:hypothetical protein